MFVILPDFLEQSKWLSEQDRDMLLRKLEEHRREFGCHEMPLTARRVFQVIARPKNLLPGVYYCVSVMPAYAYSFLAPSIIHSYTTGAFHTQLIFVPLWACGFAATLAMAALIDRLRHRCAFAIAPMSLAVTGYAILLRVHNDAALMTARPSWQSMASGQHCP